MNLPIQENRYDRIYFLETERRTEGRLFEERVHCRFDALIRQGAADSDAKTVERKAYGELPTGRGIVPYGRESPAGFRGNGSFSMSTLWGVPCTPATTPSSKSLFTRACCRPLERQSIKSPFVQTDIGRDTRKTRRSQGCRLNW